MLMDILVADALHQNVHQHLLRHMIGYPFYLLTNQNLYDSPFPSKERLVKRWIRKWKLFQWPKVQNYKCFSSFWHSKNKFRHAQRRLYKAFFWWKCTDPIIFGIWNGTIPPWAAKRRMEELKIPYESRKVHCNSHASHNFSPWMA